MNVSLTNKLEGFVNQLVEEAHDCSASKLVRERLRDLEIREAHDQRDLDDRLSNLIEADTIGKSYNISPGRYIHTSDAETYRPIALAA